MAAAQPSADASWLTSLLSSPCTSPPPSDCSLFALEQALRSNPLFPSTLLDLCSAFPSALPPGFLARLLAAIHALPSPKLPSVPPGEQPYYLTLRAGLAALHAHLQPHFEALHARLGMPFAGPSPAASTTTLLFSARSALLPLLSMPEAAGLRAVCRDCKAAVEGFPWTDQATKLRSRASLAGWRAAFPAAQAINLSRLGGAGDADLAACAQLQLRAVDLSSRLGITGATFAPALTPHCTHLNLAGCRGVLGSSLAAFHPSLSRLHTLDISDCPGLRDEHLAPLGGGLLVLRAARCSGLSGAFARHFQGGRLQELNLSGNSHPDFGAPASAAAFGALSCLATLCVARCAGLTDAHFEALAGAGGGGGGAGSSRSSSGGGTWGLSSLRVLDISECSSPALTAASFRHFGGVRLLYMGGCRQQGIDASAMSYLGGGSLELLAMSFCRPEVVRAGLAMGLPVRV